MTVWILYIIKADFVIIGKELYIFMLIAVLNCGTSSLKIAYRVEEAGASYRIYESDVTHEELMSDGVSGIIISGSADSVYDEDVCAKCDPAIFDLGIPVLGICYGMQVEAHYLGGEVIKAEQSEFGDTMLYVTQDHPIMSAVSGDISMSHNDRVTVLPRGFTAVGKTDITPIAAMVNDERKIYGVQFHPERNESTIRIITWFVDLCKLEE